MEEGNLFETLIEKLGGRFSGSLGIDLEGGASGEVFKWFLASILFGARISEQIVLKAYREFETRGILSPEELLGTGWDGLVGILDAGGYVRYDFKTATKLLEVMGTLTGRYHGDLNELHALAESPKDLERRVRGLGKGIGPATVNIFLRELRGVWEKADPLPQNLVVLAANRLGLAWGEKPEVVLSQLKGRWESDGLKSVSFADFESSLVRLAKDYCRKERCGDCVVSGFCAAHRSR